MIKRLLSPVNLKRLLSPLNPQADGTVDSRSGDWIVGRQGHQDKLPDEHYLNLALGPYDIIEAHFLSAAAGPKVLKYKQFFVISDPGQNTMPYPHPAVGEVILEVRFLPFEGSCYSGEVGGNAAVCHQIVKKSSAHHPCAWPIVPPTYGINNLTCSVGPCKENQ